MSVTLPESVDAWRMVSARRSFEGTLPIASLRRLGGMLADTDGVLQFELDFGRDELGISYVDVHVKTSLVLICQRTLEPFSLPMAVDARLGLIRRESEEAGLPPDYEPLLVPDDARLNLADVMEDELLLALPLVPINPDSSLPNAITSQDPDSSGERPAENPFAVLRELKK